MTLGGLTLSGYLIPSWQWFGEVEETLSQAWLARGGDPDQTSMSTLFARLGREGQTADRDESIAAREAIESLPSALQTTIYEASRPEHIHLREARIFLPGTGSMPGDGMYWRGRLSEVAGWAFGLLANSSPD